MATSITEYIMNYIVDNFEITINKPTNSFYPPGQRGLLQEVLRDGGNQTHSVATMIGILLVDEIQSSPRMSPRDHIARYERELRYILSKCRINKLNSTHGLTGLKRSFVLLSICMCEPFKYDGFVDITEDDMLKSYATGHVKEFIRTLEELACEDEFAKDDRFDVYIYLMNKYLNYSFGRNNSSLRVYIARYLWHTKQVPVPMGTKKMLDKVKKNMAKHALDTGIKWKASVLWKETPKRNLNNLCAIIRRREKVGYAGGRYEANQSDNIQGGGKGDMKLYVGGVRYLDIQGEIASLRPLDPTGNDFTEDFLKVPLASNLLTRNKLVTITIENDDDETHPYFYNVISYIITYLYLDFNENYFKNLFSELERRFSTQRLGKMGLVRRGVGWRDYHAKGLKVSNEHFKKLNYNRVEKNKGSHKRTRSLGNIKDVEELSYIVNFTVSPYVQSLFWVKMAIELTSLIYNEVCLQDNEDKKNIPQLYPEAFEVTVKSVIGHMEHRNSAGLLKKQGTEIDLAFMKFVLKDFLKNKNSLIVKE